MDPEATAATTPPSTHLPQRVAAAHEPGRPPSATMRRAGSTSRTATPRLEALDLARLVAIIGMFVTHLLVPLGGDPGLTGLAARAGSVLAEGNASTLFAVVGGGSLVLASRTRIARGDRRGAVVQALTRGALVTAIGLLLGFIPTMITIVLVPLGLAMMIAAPLLLVPSRHLIAAVVVLAATGGWINAQVRFALQIVMEIGGPSPLDLLHPVVLARGLLLTGTYPLITWVPYVLTGIVLVRTLLEAIDLGRERAWAVRALLIAR